jgi:glycosyltransferase involved in cell wall biosynthesis
MKFDTALREYVRQKILEIGPADIVIGIPAYNSEETIAHVMKTVIEGLEKFYPDKKSVLIVSDGGSLDYTREVCQGIKAKKVHKIITIYRGLPGKGTALRAVFEAACRFNVSACAVMDSDLRSVTPEWISSLLSPVLQGYDFVSPYYMRHKYDATITNHIAYSLTRALYGKRVRQPIGGDFGFSRKLADFFTHEYVWESDVARFGIDIWMTTVALNEGFKVCEVYLGAKVHDPKDPGASLGPMFRQVVGTLFGMMPRYEHVWKNVRGSEPIPVFGAKMLLDPPPIQISLDRLVDNFNAGLDHFRMLYREILPAESYEALAGLGSSLRLAPENWARIVYDFAYTFNRWSRDKYKLVDIMTPIYYGRVASFVKETAEMSNEQADEVVEKQAAAFEAEKPYLLKRMGVWESVSTEG